ncbi:lysine N(6)-hydroxylase/L-ornithine N(5)-oxygenase family protein [Mycolicibacterium neoaurum]|uniref:lysine N(6)-hydroxylase/L-ornithine N(5)-oxygenase family protein n=1 Tax=Mycolicibacterium neoaurum TaxID=1795 RepID=UPI001F4CD4AF|nr:SidA/IucD/PvdA family monooxygenase [Mycolicibacterium neoaurum]
MSNHESTSFIPSSSRVIKVHDVVGVGFGVTGLALAAALHEAGRAENALFFDRRRGFGWHNGMLIEGSTMQVSFLKDLVTVRNPTSSFSFVSYVHAQGRLSSFINHDVLMPSRREFHDYLRWVAQQLDHMVRYDTNITSIQPVIESDIIVALDLLAGEEVVARTKNIVMGTGLRPKMPTGVQTSDRIWHSSELLDRLSELTHLPRRVIVVGAGQSAAEVASYLMDRFPHAEICSVFSRFGYSAADSNPFANRIFDPEAVDTFYSAPSDVKRSLLSYHSNTNYSCVDGDLLRALYRRHYEQTVTGVSHFRLHYASRIEKVEKAECGLIAHVKFLPTGEVTTLNSDIIVYATGYESSDPMDILGNVGNYVCQDGSGDVCIDRNYGIKTADAFRCGIYVQGATEATHGLSSTLLSVAASRAGDILNSLSRSLGWAPSGDGAY